MIRRTLTANTHVLLQSQTGFDCAFEHELHGRIAFIKVDGQYVGYEKNGATMSWKRQASFSVVSATGSPGQVDEPAWAPKVA